MQHSTELPECARVAREAERTSAAKATAASKPKAKTTAATKPKAAAKPKVAAKPKAARKPKAKAPPGEALPVEDSSDEEERLRGKEIHEMTVDEALEAAGMREWTSSSVKRTSAKEKRAPVVNVDCNLPVGDSDSEDEVPLAIRKQRK